MGYKKKLIIHIILIISPLSLLAQRDSVHFKNDIFFGIYSEVYQQPLTISYKVLCPNGSASRYGMDFYTNDSIVTSDNNDYKDNVWDKGHIAPAADFNCDLDTLRETFTYLNCALQHKNLNRGLWRSLESYERQLGLNNDVSIVVDILFSPKSKRLSTGAVVPDGFKKSIYIDGVMTECYYFPNSETIKGVTYKHYMVDCS